jgi:hypothetical protein
MKSLILFTALLAGGAVMAEKQPYLRETCVRAP